jgi:hypothetical protein
MLMALAQQPLQQEKEIDASYYGEAGLRAGALIRLGQQLQRGVGEQAPGSERNRCENDALDSALVGSEGCQSRDDTSDYV